MNSSLAHSVLRCLSPAAQISTDSINGLTKFSERAWAHSLLWLDNSGLTLYFLNRLEQLHRTEVLPAAVLARLRRNQRDNGERARLMLKEFDRINRAFDRTRVHYAVVKGFSLIPDFCPDISLRAQSDLDYKLDRHSLEAATRVLTELGYHLIRSSANEFGFLAPGEHASTASSAFAPTTKPMVELRLALWDQAVTSVPFPEPDLSPHRAPTAAYRGVKFHTLTVEDSFLLQIIHVFQHVLCCWIRISWLLELGHFLERRHNDHAFWRVLDQRSSQTPELREFAAIVIELTHQAFDAPVPSVVQEWKDSMRPAARIWLEHYADVWLLSDHPVHESSLFPPGKLVLFLHAAYLSQGVRRQVVLDRILPRKLPKPFINPEDRLSVSKTSYRCIVSTLQRVGFHLGAGLRYVWEIPRWKWLNLRSTL